MKLDYRIISYKILHIFEHRNESVLNLRKLFLSKISGDKSIVHRSTVLVNEVIRFRGRLDLMISFISGKKIRFINKKVLTVLRIGFYEIFFDSKIPDYAAVDSSVRLAHKFTNKKTKGFANAVLRKLVREKNNNKNWYKELESRRGWLSIPFWVEKRWKENFGRNSLIKLVEFINQPPKIFLRCDKMINSKIDNVFLLKKEGVKTEKYLNQFLIVKSNESKVLSSKPFKNGYISIQSPSAAAIVGCLGVEEGDVVLDVCAAPGTKTLQLANEVGNGFIYASDISPERVLLGRKDKQRHGKKNINWSLKDARKDSFIMADKILIDAPCSGTGVIGRRPDIRWRRSENDLIKFAHTQYSILKNCSKYLKKGGTLVYATCSIEPEENIKVVEQFLSLNSNYAVDKIPNSVPKSWVKDKIALNILPHEHGLDGIFAMRMKRLF